MTIKPYNLTIKMKPTHLIALLSLAAITCSAIAAPTDRSYYVTELTTQQKFDVYNDGRNTYLESIPGLVVTGATADGERYIVNGVPHEIRGFMNGKPITVIRGVAPAPKPVVPDPAAVKAQIKQLTERLETLSSRVQPATLAAAQAAVVPQVVSQFNTTAAVQQTAIAQEIKTRRPTVNDLFIYRVSPTDENLRLLIERWSKSVGWTAVWDVDRDILIGNAGEKANDFRSAIRWVLASTELGDLVVKPCFYNNSVIRVVRKTVKCNPND
jgi:hypothetical protein